ncbi:hypothetical protein CPAST_c34560 [Clostridium pasteurianum DSM 525 = ATCC 6013]|uniref:Uncharacterized protein n=1 Tax=Clostridium pasteurianum DSM 525 = ATCC 6013 TaxID=1262449 RepID=A0A0H3J8H2_CLOPA|nr:hypothetical protein [Clostridium pasteurianum]AJA49517.1 hypothetical protein CPAST_c34560 [Clostridium pasteurianum DSM 525 = ATCC 6013]AJA53505.1 hypothetical protein CLPA_c34560 [Clostridium pasteurianum DSM 525 = ATCC 6013]KRU14470.1 hypothetical protein CP6013_03728 [Clostridium pasteurianum DSM 525 = ATCC 6013]
MIEIILGVSIFFNVILYLKKQKYISMVIETQRALAEKELECELYRNNK